MVRRTNQSRDRCMAPCSRYRSQVSWIGHRRAKTMNNSAFHVFSRWIAAPMAYRRAWADFCDRCRFGRWMGFAEMRRHSVERPWGRCPAGGTKAYDDVPRDWQAEPPISSSDGHGSACRLAHQSQDGGCDGFARRIARLRHFEFGQSFVNYVCIN